MLSESTNKSRLMCPVNTHTLKGFSLFSLCSVPAEVDGQKQQGTKRLRSISKQDPIKLIAGETGVTDLLDFHG